MLENCEILPEHVDTVDQYSHYADLAQVAMLLRVHGYSFSVIYRRHCLTADDLVLWLLRSFFLLSHHVPLDLAVWSVL